MDCVFIILFLFLYLCIIKIQNKKITILCNKKIKYKNSEYIPSPSKTVLLTALLNLPLSQSKFYFLSLIKVNYKGLVVVLTNSQTQKFYNDKLNINYIEITGKYPYYPLKHNKYPLNSNFINNTIPKIIAAHKKMYMIHIVRYFIFYMWLKEYGSKYEYFIFSDLRDVMFQKHPFGWNVCKGVILTEETKLTSLLTISPQFNILYFKNRSRMNHTVINGGLLYGSYKELTYFLNYYTELYRNFGFAGYDQSLLNYIYYEITPKVFNFSVVVNEESTGYARCLASYLYLTDNIPFDNKGLIVNHDGSNPVVLHQLYAGIDYGNAIRRKKFITFIANLIN